MVGRGLLVLPAHQRTEGSLRHRVARQTERRRVVGYRYQSVAETDPWMALCTTHTTWQEAVRRYRKGGRRWATPRRLSPYAPMPHPAHSYGLWSHSTPRADCSRLFVGIAT